MIRATLSRWLPAFPVSGLSAVLCMILSVGVPTTIRAAVDGAVTGCEFTPYLPFVLICAIGLRWWQAGVVALACVAIMGGFFAGPPTELTSVCFISSAGMFLASSVLLIGLAVFLRGLIGVLQSRGADEFSSGIVFSLEQGTVWASWYGQASPVRLGSQRRVSEMMKDFLAQEELAKRLNRQS
jgi:hypothetical protein